jgi:hypothetical protein
MKKYSQRNKVTCSNGEKFTRAQAEVKIRKAKQEKLDQFFLEHGYYFCEECKRNDCKPIDCSHNVSIDECFKTGRAEMAWDINNITLRGRKCHQKHDGME